MSDYITIPLSKKGKHAGLYESIVSIEDADLADLNWTILICSDMLQYAIRRVDRKNRMLMHRIILARKLGRELLPTEYVDHADGDGLNNTRPNLRLATKAENGANRRMVSNNTSGYKGVSWHKQKKKWYAQITNKGEHIFLGLFATRELAHEAYCLKAIELFGEFADCGE